MKKLYELKKKQEEAQQAMLLKEKQDEAATSAETNGPSLNIDKGLVASRSSPALKAPSVDILSEWLTCNVPGINVSRHQVDPRSIIVSASPKVEWYADLHARFLVRIPVAFPTQAPIAHCITPIYHPNISIRGNLGWDIVANWRSDMKPADFFDLLIKLLVEPQLQFATNKEAAALFPEKDKFIAAVKNWRIANSSLRSSSSSSSASSSPATSSPLSTLEIEAALGAMTINRR